MTVNMVYLSRIYTKSGDRGETGLGDGTRVLKDDDRVVGYGEVDELNAVLGLALTLPELPEAGLIRSIQNDLFDVGADLCTPPTENEPARKALRITEAQVNRLEREIDRLNEALEPLRSFILPGGSAASAQFHVARTVCRRAERGLVKLLKQGEINPLAFQYLNRLSDLLFVLCRVANDGGKRDVLWVPGQSREG
jgi:cob(I)alamin adenosyltransferase